jgi:hypothetical protein
MNEDASGMSSWYRQLAGGLARPAGHPAYAFVLPELAIGEYPTPDDAAWLRTVCRVDAVVSLQDDADLARKGLHLDTVRAAYARHGLVFERFPVGDGDTQALAATLASVLPALHGHIGAGRTVFLHCNAGLNRAPTVAIAYLHVHRGMPLRDAGAMVKAARPCVPYMRLLEAHYAAR